MKIGDLVVEPVFDGTMHMPATAFQGTTEAQWAPHQKFLDDQGRLEFALGGFLVRTPRDRIVLVDAGIGPRSGEIRSGTGDYHGGALIDSLARLGVRPEDVTDVIFTHLHFDHIGWATQDGVMTFPNAAYRCDTRDWQHFRDSERVQPILGPIEDRLQTWEASGSLAPGLDAMSAPGHTPGSTILVLSSGAERGMLLGDVVHCPVELIDDEWSGLGDVDPDLARRTRNALAREIEGTDVPVAAAHFPGMVFGRLLSANGRRSWLVD